MENDPDTAEKLASPVGNIRTLILAISEANDLIDEDGIERINKPLYDTIAYLLKVGPPKESSGHLFPDCRANQKEYAYDSRTQTTKAQPV